MPTPNWGTVFTPRAGSEVMVDFIDGDIDRPVVIGQLRMRLASHGSQTGHSELSLGHLIQHSAQGALAMPSAAPGWAAAFTAPPTAGPSCAPQAACC